MKLVVVRRHTEEKERCKKQIKQSQRLSERFSLQNGNNRYRHDKSKGVDLAVIKLSRVPAGAKVVQFENCDNVRIGESVFVIGNSFGHGTCITAGTVSDRLRNVNGKMLMMTDCAINGGNSGGPIFNEKGLVIAAVVSGITSAEGMNFAIPSSTILRFLQNVPGVGGY